MRGKNYSKLISFFMVISSIILVSAINIIVASAACDRDGTSSNVGTNSADNIVCDAANNPSGSNVRGRNGNDNIIVDTGATTGDVQGNGGRDTITVNEGAIVDGNVIAGGGQDTIIIDGTVTGDVRGNNGRDTFIINGNANIAGLIHGGGGSDILRFEFALCPADHDITAINTDIEASSGTDSITINGVTYQWRSIATFEGNIVPANCIEVTSEQVAEIYGFTDGRLNGLICPIWLTADTMTVFDTTGADSVLVTDALLTTPPSINTLLLQNSNNTVRVYHLTTGEIQVQCDIWDTFSNAWKVDSYVFQHLADYAPYIIR